MARTGERITQMLADRGVTAVFGIPGVHNIELYRGMEGSGLTHVLARHEQGAGFMADGYARATGRPGVAYTISGPGFLNAMTPIGQAWSDSIPVLVITSCLDRPDLHHQRGRLHEMRDQIGAGVSVADWSKAALTPDAALELVDRAFREFGQGRPRPKCLHIPIDVLEEAAASGPAPTQTPAPAARPDMGPLADRLGASRCPIFIFGGGARRCGDLARRVLERAGGAAFTTYAGRGLLPPGHPQNFGAYLGRPGSEAVLASADLIVAVGTELSETDLWRARPGHKAPLMRIDVDPTVLADHHNAALAIRADARDALSALLAALDGVDCPPAWDAADIRATRGKWRNEVNAERPGILPICEALSAAIPDDTHIFSDMTGFAYAAKELWDMPCPAHWHHPTGFGTLGYALPAAIGGKIGCPDAPVLAVAGDYGFQYTLPDLATAVELGLSLPILVWDSDGLAEIERSMQSAQIAPVAVDVRNPDFRLLAKAYGAAFSQPTSAAEVAEAVLAAFDATRPTLIRVRADTAL
jgi:acetolactate synthase-1/2/3 large subunit/5-guanidino-2-oxopentanoate decarboxylase